jgi:nucleoside-diphosphate-sugar epimerase
VARILMLGGGCTGRALAAALLADGYAVRATTRTEANRAAIEAAGAECWIGTPDRLATLRGALQNVTIVCWLLGSATGAPAELRDLHTSRLRFFLGGAVDTTVRGFLYEASGTTVPPEVLAEGELIAREVGEQNAMPMAFLRAGGHDPEAWLTQARAAIEELLEG